MLSFNTVEAAVAINGVELPRHRIQYDNLNNTVTCWVPSEAGKVRPNICFYCASLINLYYLIQSFSILWSSGASHSKDTCARVWIDGAPAGAMGLRSSEHPQARSIDRVTVSPTTAHSMMFSAVDHTGASIITHLLTPIK